MIIYNDNNDFVAQWLVNLTGAGLLPFGDVYGCDLQGIPADMLRDIEQFHAFAGLGGWAYALLLAGWPREVPVWTGSCPCQPFSGAGRRLGETDARHLWPIWRDLIAECRPPVVFGEQVASPLGRKWLAAVRADLEELGYAVGAADLCAASVGAPHIRQRLWFCGVLADYFGLECGQVGEELSRSGGGGFTEGLDERLMHGGDGGVADADCSKRGSRWGSPAVSAGLSASQSTGRCDDRGGLGDSCGNRAGQHAGELRSDEAQYEVGASGGCDASEFASALSTAWADADWLPCRDGRHRPVEPGTFPLAHGAPARVGRLRAYGNAIVPQVAAVFVRCVMNYLQLTAGGGT